MTAYHGDDYQRLASYVMPFGKHKGKTLDQIPLQYLDWVVGNFDDGPCKAAVLAYLRHPTVANELDAELERWSDGVGWSREW